MLQSHVVNIHAVMAALPELDLADEADWEDAMSDGRIECITLEAAGLEEDGAEPVFGGFDEGEHVSGSVWDYTNWLMDGQTNLEE